ncbi:hypothetical protein MMC16_001661 [Acarospora aff. strigata]|nr:hypothetical protein [Acarospora aff. strigata]
MEPFTFSDGSYVPAGNVVCVPQQALMRDARYYRDPAEFDGFRFVVQEDGKLKSAPKLTDMIPSFPFWGASKKACPGRFYVSGALRQILAHFLTAYDFRLADADAPRTFVWTTAVVPRYSVALLLRERIR